MLVVRLPQISNSTPDSIHVGKSGKAVKDWRVWHVPESVLGQPYRGTKVERREVRNVSVGGGRDQMVLRSSGFTLEAERSH